MESLPDKGGKMGQSQDPRSKEKRGRATSQKEGVAKRREFHSGSGVAMEKEPKMLGGKGKPKGGEAGQKEQSLV